MHEVTRAYRGPISSRARTASNQSHAAVSSVASIAAIAESSSTVGRRPVFVRYRGAVGAPAEPGPSTGRASRKVVPVGPLSSSVSVPPCASAMPRAR